MVKLSREEHLKGTYKEFCASDASDEDPKLPGTKRHLQRIFYRPQNYDSWIQRENTGGLSKKNFNTAGVQSAWVQRENTGGLSKKNFNTANV
ncbi:hypothetical protein J6590_060369 [Homalodisca vitripennis]|nr:hypothetical protein J6590_060369 [Homalodisca vitripennis]